MVNETLTEAAAAERALALSYAPPGARAALAALLALDDRLGAIVRRATEPTIGLMRLAWWEQALAALDTGPPPAEPLLTDLAARVLPAGVRGADLAEMVEGWAVLLEAGPLDAAALEVFGRERGGRLFAAAATVLAAEDVRLTALGEGWALADLAGRVRDADVAAAARGLAGERLDAGFGGPWARELRALGALGLLARSDLRGAAPGSPARVTRLAWHRLTGR